MDEEDVDDDPIAPTEPNVPTPTNISLLPVLTNPLLTLARPTPLSFTPPSTQAIHPPTTSALGTIHIRALECLNNLFLSINPDSLPPTAKTAAVAVWNDLWVVLGSVGKQSEWMMGLGQERRKEMWDIALGVLWGLARIGKGELVCTSS